MLRAFDGHEKRTVRALDGEWYFITDKENKGESLGYPSAIPTEAEKTFVPSVWNTAFGLLEYEGALPKKEGSVYGYEYFDPTEEQWKELTEGIILRSYSDTQPAVVCNYKAV